MNEVSNKILTILEKHNIEFSVNRNNQAITKYCPFCHGGEHNDMNTFAISLHSGAFNCKRGGCGKTGTLRDFCNLFGEKTDIQYSFKQEQKKKVYEKPDPNILQPLTEEALTYFALRRISKETLNAFKVGCDDKGNIVFPLFLDKELVGAKFRKPKKHVKGEGPKEWCVSGMNPILFGMDNVSFNNPLYITEGEIDALSLYEAGITNVVSVSMGCENLEFIDNCWDWLEKFPQIILFGDNDECGLRMMETLGKSLGEDRCLKPKPYPEWIVNGKDMNRLCKDANEILYAYGADELKEIAESCDFMPIKGILNLADVPFVDPTTVPRIYTNIPALDNAIGGLGEGGITVLSGKRGEGKSTIGGSLLLNAIHQGYKVCAYSGELSKQKFLEWTMLQATESKYISTRIDYNTGKTYPYVPLNIQTRIREWIDDKFYLFDNECISDEEQINAILKIFTMCARRYGCKLFLVDNMMIALSSSVDEELRGQAKFAAALKAFAVKYKVHVILVAHPRKTQVGSTFTSDDVSGSSTITNIADNVISIEKPNIRVTKNREFGICEYIECNYNPANRRIYQANTGDVTIYGWDHNGIDEPETKAQDISEFKVQTDQTKDYPF